MTGFLAPLLTPLNIALYIIAINFTAFIAFGIVSTMIGFRLLSGLPPVLGRVWDFAVICNVMGVGVDRLYRSWSR